MRRAIIRKRNSSNCVVVMKSYDHFIYDDQAFNTLRFLQKQKNSLMFGSFKSSETLFSTYFY